MQMHEIKRENRNKAKKTVGRGGKRGYTSGRGAKGQNARAGNKKRPEIRDFIKKFPKNRGYKFSSIQTKPTVINVAKLEEVFDSGESITPKVLIEKEVIRRKKGKVPAVKILGNGELTKSFNISNCLISSSAKEKIEKAGGKVE